MLDALVKVCEIEGYVHVSKGYVHVSKGYVRVSKALICSFHPKYCRSWLDYFFVACLGSVNSCVNDAKPP